MYLHRAHGEKVVILIDEYDAPIHAGYAGVYAPRILDFFRAFVSAGLEGNPHLYRAVVTGVLRVSKESLFSGAVRPSTIRERGLRPGAREVRAEQREADRFGELTPVRTTRRRGRGGYLVLRSAGWPLRRDGERRAILGHGSDPHRPRGRPA
jgi:Predicted AAA-ATPase